MSSKGIPLESAVEKEFLRLLKAFPVTLKVRKLNGLGYRSWPDRLILGPNKFMMMVELKRPKIGKLSEGQKDLFAEFKELGHDVAVHDVAGEAALHVKYELMRHGAWHD